MKTKKQEELINTFLTEFDEESKSIYQDLVIYLSELGYNPKKEGSKISFKHDLHNKQIAKMGTNASKKHGVSPAFSLRFSACQGYSQKFSDIISFYIMKYPTRVAQCLKGDCTFCSGEASTRVYTYSSSDGEIKTHCGAYAIEIPNLTKDDIVELKKLIKEEHDYLMNYEVN